MADGPNLRLTSDRIDALVDELTSVPDRRVATKVEELLSLLLELQGVALGRIVEVVDRVTPDASEVFGRILDDDLLSSLLRLHGLHPDGLTAGMEEALAAPAPVPVAVSLKPRAKA